jgi:hypothetical protein
MLRARVVRPDVFVDGVLEGFQAAVGLGVRGSFVGIEEWSSPSPTPRVRSPPAEAVLELDVEHGNADAFGGEDVGVLVRDALDESM